MLGDQPHVSFTLPDQKDTSGEEAWARRSSLPALSEWLPRTVETEGSPPSILDAVEEGEILERQPLNQFLPLKHQPPTLDAHSFLHSIPQWQPSSKQPTSQPSFKIPRRPDPAQQKGPTSARSQGMPPASRAPIRQSKGPSTSPPGFQIPVPVDLGFDEKIPGLYKKDALDNRIGIRPRNKASNELRQIKSLRDFGGVKWNLPPTMKIIVQQFIVANRYVYTNGPKADSEQSVLRNSLLIRLDLHNTSLTTRETKEEQMLIKSTWASIDKYIWERSREWRAQGVFAQVTETARPTFAAFTNGWLARNWDGSTQDLTSATFLTTVLPTYPVSPKHPNRISKTKGPGNIGGTTRQIFLLPEGPMENAYTESKPILKRPSQDGHDTQANKWACNRGFTRITNNDVHVDQVHNEEGSLEITTPGEEPLPIVIEAIRHAQATMSDLAPMSSNELAIMQQAWTSHGFPTMLADTLKVGQAYTTMMGNYFDHALDFLDPVKESGHLKAGRLQVQVSYAYQGGLFASEQSQNGGLRDPSLQLSRELEDQHSYERGSQDFDRSQDGEGDKQPLPSTEDAKVDRSSQPEEGVGSEQLQKEIASGEPASITENAQVDHLCEPTAATPEVQNEGVAGPEVPIEVGEKCCML